MACDPNLILVTGDFVVDHHTYEGSRLHYGDKEPGVLFVEELGGAALVSGILNQMPAAKPKAATFSPDTLGPYQHAYAYWHPAPGKPPKEDCFWRCRQPMGFGDAPFGHRVTLRPSGLARLNGLPEKPGIIVVFDSAGNFRDDEKNWASLEFEHANTIILKTASPLLKGPLWGKLSGADLKDKLTIVVSADELRRHGAKISTSLSWEATFGDLLVELDAVQHGILADLTKARHLVVTFGSEGAAWLNCQSHEDDTKKDLVWFLYRAGNIEYDHAYATKGKAFGFLSCMTAALARASTKSVQDSKTFDYGAAIEGGLEAMHNLREKGHGPAYEKPKGFPAKRLAKAIVSTEICIPRVVQTLEAARNVLKGANATFLSLAGDPDAGGNPRALALDFARLVAEHGPLALETLPHLRLGDLITADRSDVEALRALTQVVRHYYDNDKGKRPLSLGVFGPPGAGKSYAVRQLANEFLGDDGEWREFNLSQFSTVDELNGAFHQIRDFVLQGKLPIAFFDEFDSHNYKWLQYLLAPMQDGRFQHGQLTHTLGKCIFIFAGGTSWTFRSFGPPDPNQSEERDEETQRRFDTFRQSKGPDFKSRLDAFLNVVGPNRRPRQAKALDTGPVYLLSGHKLAEDDGDIWFPIRRALMIRSDLELKPEQRLEIDSGLLHALLKVKRYEHGSRSLSKIISPLKGSLPGSIQLSFLLPDSQLSMHCDLEDFGRLINHPKAVLPNPTATNQSALVLDVQAYETIAEAINDTYNAHGLRAGWLKPKDALSWTKFKARRKNGFKVKSNVEAAHRMPAILKHVGLRLEPGRITEQELLLVVQQQIDCHLEMLANAEHEAWMKWHQDNGWTYGPKKDEDKKQHPCMLPFTKLKDEERVKDRVQIRHYPEFANRAGYKIVFAKP